MAKLALKRFNTYHVDWFTNSWDRKADKLGLNHFLAQCMGLDERLELFEADNDSDYKVHVKLDEDDKKEFWVQDRQLAWEEAIKNKGFEHWRFHDILIAALERGFIPPGHYVINYSY
jgi:hypothetical protein